MFKPRPPPGRVTKGKPYRNDVGIATERVPGLPALARLVYPTAAHVGGGAGRTVDPHGRAGPVEHERCRRSPRLRGSNRSGRRRRSGLFGRSTSQRCRSKRSGIVCGKAVLALRDVEAIVVPWKYWQIGRRVRLAVTAMMCSTQLFRVKGTRSLERASQEWMELFRLREELTRRVDAGAIRPVFLDHHLCHAASSFLVSPYEQSAILVVDGASESDTTLMAAGADRQITVLDRTPLPHSLGQFYAAMTAFLGFRPDQDEYIVMGLASSGDPAFAPALRREILRLLPRGRFELNTRLLDFHLARAGVFVAEFVRFVRCSSARHGRDHSTASRSCRRGGAIGSGGDAAASGAASTFTDQSRFALPGGVGSRITVWRMGACEPNWDSAMCMSRRLRENSGCGARGCLVVVGQARSSHDKAGVSRCLP
jgi:hypothetical protein